MGAAPPPVLNRFLTEREFWKELGVSTGVRLADMPHLLVRDYELIIGMIRREEQARASRR
jgi:hypothetical protein